MTKQTLIFTIFALLATTGVRAMEDLPDPTRPSGAGAGDGLPHGGEFVLQSTVLSPGRAVAVINGQRLTVGERLRGAELVAIRAYEVVLRRDGRDIVVRLMPKLAIEPNTNGSKP